MPNRPVSQIRHSFTANGQGAALQVSPGFYNLIAKGTFVGDLKPKVSFDNGATWDAVGDASGGELVVTGADVPFAEVVREPANCLVRWEMSNYTSGTAATEINQG